MAETHPNSRLEAFCDGVFAIAMTLLIIDIRIPVTESIHSNEDFWHALEHIAPSIFAFILSFTIIFITWVNHHAGLKLTNKTSHSFIYANGLMLLTVVFLPFPTSLLGEYILTAQAAPAVILFNGVLAIQAISWIFFYWACIKNNLGKNERSIQTIHENLKFGYVAFIIYTISAIIAIWFPITIAILTTSIWIFWLILGIKMKHE